MVGSGQPIFWDVTQAAPLHSQLSGVLAGVAFLGLTLVLTRQVPTDGPEGERLARLTIGEFFVAFLTLSVAALEWGIIAGETDPVLVRPSAASVFATVTLAVGALRMIAGVCYLVMDFESPTVNSTGAQTLTRTCLTGYHLISGLAAFNIGLTAADTLSRGSTGKEFPPSGAWYVLPVLVGIVVWACQLPAVRRRTTAQTVRMDENESGNYRRLVGYLIVGCIVAFSLTVNAPATTELSELGEWTWSRGIILYVVGILAAGLASGFVFVLQGWTIDQYSEEVLSRHVATEPNEEAASDPRS